MWARHLATSRAQSEVAVTQMLKAFADIGPHINMAERQSQQITEALSTGDQGIIRLGEACEQALAPLLQDASLPEEHKTALRHVIAIVQQAVNALDNIAKPFTHETKMVAAQVERMYIGFQYQDRVSQMMTLLEGDIARLQEAVQAQGQGNTDLRAWLARLESQYAMAEQHQDHAGTKSPHKGAGDGKETTYF